MLCFVWVIDGVCRFRISTLRSELFICLSVRDSDRLRMLVWSLSCYRCVLFGWSTGFAGFVFRHSLNSIYLNFSFVSQVGDELRSQCTGMGDVMRKWSNSENSRIWLAKSVWIEGRIWHMQGSQQHLYVPVCDINRLNRHRMKPHGFIWIFDTRSKKNTNNAFLIWISIIFYHISLTREAVTSRNLGSTGHFAKSSHFQPVFHVGTGNYAGMHMFSTDIYCQRHEISLYQHLSHVRTGNWARYMGFQPICTGLLDDFNEIIVQMK
jgi:hypothetical protein